MPTYEITGPDGAVYEIDAPEGATEQQALDFFKQQMGQTRKSYEPLLPNFDSLLDTSKPPKEIIAKVAESLKSLPEPQRVEALKEWADKYAYLERLRMGGTKRTVQDELSGFVSQIPVLGSLVDETVAGLGSATLGTDYDVTRALIAAKQAQSNEDASLASKGAGLASTLVLPATNIAKLGTAGNAALTGLLYGAGEGLAAADENRLAGGVQGGVTGALIGGVFGKLLSKIFGKETVNSLPQIDQLKTTAQKIFDKIDQSGVRVSGQSVKGMATDLLRQPVKMGFSKRQHPEVEKAILDATDLFRSSGATISNFQNYRSNLGSVEARLRKSGDKKQAAMIKSMVDVIDNKLVSLKPKDLVGTARANVKEILSDLQQGREIWRRFRRSEELEQLFSKAELRATQFTNTGMDNALVTELRQLARNPARMAKFSKAEQDSIRKIVLGGTVENALRKVGKLNIRNPFVYGTAMGTGGSGLAMGGPVAGLGAAAIPVGIGLAGSVAKGVAESMRIGKFNQLEQLVRGGQRTPVPVKQGPYTQSIGKLILQNAGR